MRLQLLLIFILGCATGAATSSLVGRAGAAPAPGTPRWEYQCVAGLHWKDLNALGGQGWELVTSGPDGSDLCLKRPAGTIANPL